MFPKDATTGFLRRQIFFPATNVVPDGKEIPLIQISGPEKVIGPLSEELSGMYNWVSGLQPKEAEAVLCFSRELVPSLSNNPLQHSLFSNSIASWIAEELLPGEGLFLGGASGNEASKLAYPLYSTFCKRQGLRPVSLRMFSFNVVSIIHSQFSETFKDVSIVRRAAGMYIKGVAVNPVVFDADYQRGGSVGSDSKGVLNAHNNDSMEIQSRSNVVVNVSANVQSLPSNHSSSQERQNAYSTPFPKQNHPGLHPKLVQSYVNLLEAKSPIKVFLRKRAPEIPFSLDIDQFAPSGASRLYKESLMKVLVRGLENYKKRGPVVDTYAAFGSSPRIGPYQYGSSYNAIKKSLRSKLLYWSAKDLSTKTPYVFLDIDLVSCYTSILLGLYNERLPSVNNAVSIGLWNYIEEEFKKQGLEKEFHKPSVKIAVHSSLFRGGNNAMIQGILEKHRKDAGMHPKEWRLCPDREVVLARAQTIVNILQTSNIILELRELSNYLDSLWKGQLIQGPSGHQYRVSTETFPSNYASFLQSYEISLLANSLLLVKEEFPQLIVLGHFHDGALLVFPKELPIRSVQESLDKAAETTRCRLDLVFPQRFSSEVLFQYNYFVIKVEIILHYAALLHFKKSF